MLAGPLAAVLRARTSTRLVHTSRVLRSEGGSAPMSDDERRKMARRYRQRTVAPPAAPGSSLMQQPNAPPPAEYEPPQVEYEQPSLGSRMKSSFVTGIGMTLGMIAVLGLLRSIGLEGENMGSNGNASLMEAQTEHSAEGAPCQKHLR
jgi:hypothetical protein